MVASSAGVTIFMDHKNWKGLSPEESSWEPPMNMDAPEHLVLRKGGHKGGGTVTSLSEARVYFHYSIYLPLWCSERLCSPVVQLLRRAVRPVVLTAAALWCVHALVFSDLKVQCVFLFCSPSNGSSLVVI